MPEPWIWKPRERGLDKPLVGRPPSYNARSMIVLCLFKVYSDNSFRWLEGFLREYNQQRRAEAFFSKMKRRFGSSIRSRIGTMRRREVWMRILILNMLAVASEEVAQELAAMAG